MCVKFQFIELFEMVLCTKAPSDEGAVAKRLRERKSRYFNGFLSPSHGYAVPAPSSEGAFGAMLQQLDKLEFEQNIYDNPYCVGGV